MLSIKYFHKLQRRIYLKIIFLNETNITNIKFNSLAIIFLFSSSLFSLTAIHSFTFISCSELIIDIDDTDDVRSIVNSVNGKEKCECLDALLQHIPFVVEEDNNFLAVVSSSQKI